MDLIDRYLVAVRRHLPEPLQKDLAEELADILRSEAVFEALNELWRLFSSRRETSA